MATFIIMGNFTPYKWLQVISGLVLSQYISCDCSLPVLDFSNGKVLSPTIVDLVNHTDVVKELTVLQFTCYHGYFLVGNKYLQCVDYEWTSEVPFCAGRKCPDPPPLVENATFVVKYELTTTPMYRSLAEYSCNAGYELYNRNAFTLECKLDTRGRTVRWEGEKPICRDIFCPPPPLLAHGTIPELQATHLTKFPYSFEINYICDEGYEISGANSRRMCNHRGVWSGDEPICEEKLSCEHPGAPFPGTRIGKCCSVGDSLSSTCKDGYELVGNAEIRCGRYGIWSSQPPLCRPPKPYCEFPVAIPNLRWKGSKFGGYFTPGTELKVWCKPGYKYEGHMHNLCLRGGKWEYPFGVCKEVFCDPPLPFEFGTIPELQTTNLTKFPYSFEINYICHEGYRLFGADSWRTCNREGVWSGDMPKCEAIQCPDPGTPENGLKRGSIYSVGFKVRFRCLPGYEFLGEEEIICQPNGQWTGKPARCNKPSNYCPDPGAPIGGFKSTSVYKQGTKVDFSCQDKTILLGSEARYCLRDRTWSGTPTECVGPYVFDNSEQVKRILLIKLEERKEQQRKELGGRQHRNLFERMILYFAFDVSRRITLPNFKKSIAFTKSIVKKVGVSKHGVRVGALTFGSRAEAIFLPLEYQTTEDVLDALDNIKYISTGMRDASPLELIEVEIMPLMNHIFGKKIKHVIFILTDGRSSRGKYLKAEADKLKGTGAEIYCIGVTGNAKKELLDDIASTSKYGANTRPNTFYLQDYSPFDWLVKDVVSRTAARTSSQYDSACGLRQGSNNVAKVVGGRRAMYPWPWMAALYMTEIGDIPYGLSMRCGGSVIHRYFVLTAAHCLFNGINQVVKIEDIIVKLGLTDRGVTTHLQEYVVRNIHLHPNYKRQSFDYDIALLELRTSILFNDFVGPVCLPPRETPQDSLDDDLYQPNSIVWITGWGHVNTVKKFHPTPRILSRHLKEIALPIRSRETCTESLSDDDVAHYFTDRMFCAGTSGERNDSCGGDSGGPVMKPNLNKAGRISWIQVGIVSWGLGCGIEKEYGIYVRLQGFIPWIDDTVGAAMRWRGV